MHLLHVKQEIKRFISEQIIFLSNNDFLTATYTKQNLNLFNFQ